MTVDLIVIGLVTGATYGLLGLGLTLVYRLAGTINLAHGEIGAFGAAAVAVLTVRYDWPIVPAVAVGILGGALVAGLTELVVMKRLGDRSNVVVMVATLGAGQLVALLRISLPDLALLDPYPSLSDARLSFGSVDLSGGEVAALVAAPVVAFVVWFVMARTTAGAVVRATAANPEATRLVGVNAAFVSTAVWVGAGALAAIATIVVIPLRSGTAVAVATIGPGLLLRGFAAAAFGRFRSIVGTIVGGLVLGVSEALAIQWSGDPGTTNLVVFALVLIGLAALPRDDADGDVRRTLARRSWEAWPDTLRVRLARFGPGAFAVVALVALPYVVTSAGNTFQLSRLVVLALVVASATVLAGWSAQLSLAQFALVGVGAIVSARVVEQGTPWELSLVAAMAAAAIMAVLVAIPTSRLRGSQLAIATLGLAVMAPAWLFRLGITGDQQIFEVPRVDFGLFELRPQRAYYFFALALTSVVFAALGAIGRSASGRRWRAVADNERAAAALGVSPIRTRLTSFGLSGAVAGLAGGLYGGLFVNFRRGEFAPGDSIEVVVMGVIGGLGSLAGAALGVVYVGALPAFFSDLESLQLLVSGVGLLALLIYFPDGLASLARRGQEALAGPSLPHRHERDADATATGGAASIARLAAHQSGSATGNGLGASIAIGCSDVSVEFGSVQAVAGVSLSIASGSIVGIIGANGAGKSTLLDALSGLRLSSGRVEIDGHDVTGIAPHRRTHYGLGRTFQDARLFPGLTVRETVMVAAATRERSHLVLDAVVPARWSRSEQRIAKRADAVIESTGLNDFALERCGVLSTGTRRLVEMACLIAAGGRVVLLDEPTAGLAQREVEAFPSILRALRDHLDATVVIVEHDVAMLSNVCDRLVCLETGRVIADGSPDEVRADPLVIESYLGTDAVSIERSAQCVSPK